MVVDGECQALKHSHTSSFIMAKTAILYIDLLGVQQLWSLGGAIAVGDRIHEFNDFVIRQLGFLPGDIHRDGEYTVILSGDSLTVTCQDFDQAVGLGTHLFKQAFYARSVSKPLWLRGAISPWHNQYIPHNTRPIHAKGMQVGTEYVAEDDYLHVLALEKSGFRGMRLIVNRDFLVDYGSYHTRQWDGMHRPLHFVTRLREEHMYPIGNNYADILWMADSADHYARLKGIMAQRFKRATADIGELNQAAWTRAVFDQVESLIWMCRQEHLSGYPALDTGYDINDSRTGDGEESKSPPPLTGEPPVDTVVEIVSADDRAAATDSTPYEDQPVREPIRSKRKRKLEDQ
jgi:hypothetical protein